VSRAGDLTAKEQARVRAALRYLKIRHGGWDRLAAALGNCREQVYRVGNGSAPAAASMAIRVARLAEVPVSDILDGRFPPPGTCPHCGRRPEEFFDEETVVE